MFCIGVSGPKLSRCLWSAHSACPSMNRSSTICNCIDERQFMRAFRRPDDDPSIFAIELETGFINSSRRKKFRIFWTTSVFPCHCPGRIRHPIHFARIQSWSRAPNCNGYRIWIINKQFRNSEHHLLSSMTSGEHPLRVGT